MSRSNPGFRLVALTLLGLVAGASAARADLTTAFQSVVTNANGSYTYTYQVSLSNNSQLDGTSAGLPVQFGTVYDFGAIVGGVGGIVAASGSILATGFTFSLANTNSPAAQTSPVDRPTLQNIRFTYTGQVNYATAPAGSDGSYVIIQPGDGNVGTFTVQSLFSTDSSSQQAYDGQSYKSNNNTQQSNIGLVQVPFPPASDVPEPASMALLGAGLLAAGIARRRSA